MGKRKTFQELEISDAFMFAALMEDQKVCKEFLQMVLGRSIETVWVRTERVLGLNRDRRSVRLDVFVDDGQDSVYDIEMQGRKEKGLSKRARFYQSQMDVAGLKPRGEYTFIRRSYIIFICLFDPFGKGRYRYTFEERCLEESFSLGDETQKIFLSTEGKNPEEISKELVLFLNYVKNAVSVRKEIPEDSFVNLVEKRLRKLKDSDGLEAEYMLFGELLDDEREEGRADTKAEVVSLIAKLVKEGKTDLLPRLKDPEFLEILLKEYNCRVE